MLLPKKLDKYYDKSENVVFLGDFNAVIEETTMNFSQRIYKVCTMIIRKTPVDKNSRRKFSHKSYKTTYLL